MWSFHYEYLLTSADMLEYYPVSSVKNILIAQQHCGRTDPVQTLTENSSCYYCTAEMLLIRCLLLRDQFRQGDVTKYQLDSGSTQHFVFNSSA